MYNAEKIQQYLDEGYKVESVISNREGVVEWVEKLNVYVRKSKKAPLRVVVFDDITIEFKKNKNEITLQGD